MPRKLNFIYANIFVCGTDEFKHVWKKQRFNAGTTPSGEQFLSGTIAHTQFVWTTGRQKIIALSFTTDWLYRTGRIATVRANSRTIQSSQT